MILAHRIKTERFRLLVTISSALIMLGLLLFGASTISAKSFSYDSYDVDITVNQDTTMTVVEKLNYVFDGSYSEIYRGIQIDNPDVRRACQSSGGQTCGGFEYIVLEEVRDNKGLILPRDAYQVGREEDDDENSYYVIRWKFGSRYFDGKEVFGVQIKYKVFGAVRFVGEFPYVYWNVLARDKGGAVDRSRISLKLPEETPEIGRLDVYGNFRYATKVQGRTVTIDAEALPANGDFTIAYQLSKGALARPAHVKINGNPIGQRLFIDGVRVGETDFELNYFPPGPHKIRGEFNGYKSLELNVDIKEGDDVTIDLTLQPEPFTQLLIYINLLCMCLGCLLTPFSVFVVYMIWRRRGRDQDKIDTIIPIFHPPLKMRPYLVGSLADEVVDKRDISGSIIDLAYRGYLKIKELEAGKNYLLTDTGKDQADLTAVERKLFTALFDGSSEVETKDLAVHFATKYQGIVNQVYSQMVSEGYFTTSPQATRNSYAGCGVGLLILGGMMIFALAIGVIALLGQLGPITLGVAVFMFGLTLAIASKYMPAKTTFGSKIHTEVLGFKMYLETAEKYRLQNLTPAEFEKYLSYAVVFGIEDQWAEKFKDIYREAPDWYEASSPDVFSTYWLSRSLHNFSNNMQSSVFTPVSGGSSGSGWSGGGGSFGGFSGGGGGGGFSGAN
jgi:uncharacterized membrane protein YgcG